MLLINKMLNMRKLSLFASIIGLIVITSCNQVDKEVSKQFNDFLDRKFEEGLMRNPEFASSLGLKYGNGNWTDRSEQFYDKEYEIAKVTLDSLCMMDTAKLDDNSKLSLQLFKEEVLKMEEGQKWKNYYYELNQMGGVVTDMPAFLINVHTIDTLQEAKDYIGRLNAYNIPFEQTIENIEKSKAKGIVPPQFTFPYVKESIISFEKMFSNSDDNVLIIDFKSKVEKLSIAQPEKDTLIAQAKLAIANKVLPAYKNMGVYWTSLSPSSTQNQGVWSLPKGNEYYQYCIKNSTTTNYTPDEVFAIGEKEVARIHGEMKQIMKKVNFKNDNLQDFFQFVRTDKQFLYTNDAAGRKALLDDANKYINGTKSKYQSLFKTFPKADVVVMAVEKFREQSVGGAFYENPTLDGKRPGRYYVNLFNMADEPKYQMEALTAHEAIPGHHMQIAIAQELTDIPKFRKHGGNTAYIEGWALYAELLNKEMGFYQDPYSDFGRLSMEIFRAARLVVDVGIHYKKWTREQAIDYFMKNTANAEGDIHKEIERYFLWPGQALGYKIGMLKILELREKSKKEMGTKFDIKEFHDIVLKNGSVPLNVLERLISNWNTSKK
jgi:uncharacterized protein (DUF885 family)